MEMARKGAILHDLGKAHPHFQHKIGGIPRYPGEQIENLNASKHTGMSCLRSAFYRFSQKQNGIP